jgi:hypothetical protein
VLVICAYILYVYMSDLSSDIVPLQLLNVTPLNRFENNGDDYKIMNLACQQCRLIIIVKLKLM